MIDNYGEIVGTEVEWDREGVRREKSLYVLDSVCLFSTSVCVCVCVCEM